MSPLIWWQIIWLPPIWIQFISCSLSVVVIQLLSCITLCNHMDCSIPAFPVFHYLPEFAQTQVHSVGDAIQPSHPLLPPFPPIPNLSQYWGLFQWVGFSHLVAKVLKLQLQYQSFQWICRLIFIFMILRFFFKKERMLLYLTWRETCSSLQMWLGNRWGASRTLCYVPRSIPAGVLWMGYPEASSLCLRAALFHPLRTRKRCCGIHRENQQGGVWICHSKCFHGPKNWEMSPPATKEPLELLYINTGRTLKGVSSVFIL